jgi:hypothetical protein
MLSFIASAATPRRQSPSRRSDFPRGHHGDHRYPDIQASALRALEEAERAATAEAMARAIREQRQSE